jgi:hypothetical protein
VAAAVDVDHGERSCSLESVREVVERWFGESAFELCWVGEKIEDTGCEVTSQTRSTLGLADVDLEVGACEGAVLDAASPRTTKLVKAEYVLSGSECDVFSVAAEACCGREDLCLVWGCGVTVVGLCVERPVPVSICCQLGSRV